jgi:hypothetical protein
MKDESIISGTIVKRNVSNEMDKSSAADDGMHFSLVGGRATWATDKKRMKKEDDVTYIFDYLKRQDVC